MVTKEHQARVRWHCRRGMLELDEILQNFFDKHYLHLSTREQELFERLLECPDQDLFKWLLGQTHPSDVELIAMINKIKLSRD
jgi:antitoxin CptB